MIVIIVVVVAVIVIAIATAGTPAFACQLGDGR
jgi:hypothetical protein